MGCRSGTTDSSSSGQPTSASAKGSGNIVETKAFRLTVPEGVVNDSKSAREEGSILLSYGRPYGRVSVEVFLSQLDLEGATVTRSGEVSESEVTIDGKRATRVDQDLRKVIFGTSEKDLLRYIIKIDKIPKPSERKYTVLSIDLLSRQSVSASDVGAFKAEAQVLIDSLVIK